MSTEEERISKLLNSELEASLFKDNCDQGVHVEGALLAEMKRRVSPKNNRKHQPKREPESISSLAQVLSLNDPFAAASTSSSDNNASSYNSFFGRSSKVSERQQSGEAKLRDPFAVIGAMTNVVRKQFSSSSSVAQQSSGTYFACDEHC
jgi:hypothetical protein